jgi:hypothetical protein
VLLDVLLSLAKGINLVLRSSGSLLRCKLNVCLSF